MQEVNYSTDELDTIKEKLMALEPRAKRFCSKSEAIVYMKDAIDALMEKNYLVSEIATLLAENGIAIAPSTLRTYLREKTKTTTKKRQKRVKRGIEKIEPEKSDEVKNDAIEAVSTASFALEPDTAL